MSQAWLPVSGDRVAPASLRAVLLSLAWPVWQQAVAHNGEAPSPQLKASIVVCTRDRTEQLARCLQRLRRLPAEGHEVIVVDSCPQDDKTARLVASYPEIRYLREPRPGAGIARNRGLLAAKREIVAFTDDDALVDANWLEALLSNFQDPLVAIVTGITMPLELETEAQLWFEETNGFGRGFVRKQFDVLTMSPLLAGLAGASVNVAIRRSAVDKIGLFVEELGPGTPCRSGEDHEFFYRALARGYRIVYDPAALVWHKHRREWHALRDTIYGYGVGVFAWWTYALLVEKELTLLVRAPLWFLQHHVRNLLRSLLRRPDHIPLDLAWAEFAGGLTGPIHYLRSRRQIRRQKWAAQQVETGPTAMKPATLADKQRASVVSQPVETK